MQSAQSTTLFYFLLALPISAAVPVPEEHQFQTADNFYGSPNTRGTLNILFSCSSALVFCIWTGINLDAKLEEGSPKDSLRLLGRILWAIIALAAPDIVLIVALHQYLVAGQYIKGVEKSMRSKMPWDLVDNTQTNIGELLHSVPA